MSRRGHADTPARLYNKWIEYTAVSSDSARNLGRTARVSNGYGRFEAGWRMGEFACQEISIVA